MSQRQKILTTILWAVLVIAMVGVLAAGFLRDRTRAAKPGHGEHSAVTNVSAQPAALDVPVPDFSLVDQDNQPVSLASLKGQVWIADFIFTNCGGPCPLMTARMSRLQGEIADPSVRLISFSVDPKRDTPAVLKAYGEKFKADQSRWKFLTGDSATIQNVARGMLATVQPETANAAIIHSERFMLIDADGRMRLAAHSLDEQAMDHLIKQAGVLAAANRKAATP